MFEPREYRFLPTAGGLKAGDIITAMGHTKIMNGPLEVLAVDAAPGVIRAQMRDEEGNEFWVTLLANHEVTLKPPF